MRIGERVLLLAEEKGIKRAHLASALGVGRSTVTGWEKENRNPSSELIVPICELLGVSPHFLLTGNEKPNSFKKSEDEKLLNRYQLLDEDGQEVVRVTALYEWRRMQGQQTPLEQQGRCEEPKLVPAGAPAPKTIAAAKAPPGKPQKDKKQAQ